jgi:hypothetical protein
LRKSIRTSSIVVRLGSVLTVSAASIATLLLAVSIPGCGEDRSVQRSPERIIIVLADISGSTGVAAVEALYKAQFEALIRAVQPGDALLVDLIQDQSILRSSFPINERFQRFRPVSQGFTGAQRDEAEFLVRLRERKRQLTLRFAELLNAPRSARTDIMSALLAAEQALASFPGAKDRYLILISDMVEDSERYNFSRPGLTPADFQRILQRETDAKRVPDLRGVQVLVTGAGGPNSSQWLRIRDFWTAYVGAAGGQLRSYGHSLVEIPLAPKSGAGR